MDKPLVNHQIVVMRKQIRLGKHQVRQKLFKQINELKKKLENHQKRQEEGTGAPNDIDKLKKKIALRQKEAASLKSLDQDLISKKALAHDADYFKDILQKPDQASSERLVALVCASKQVQAAVKKFKQDNPDSELWLPELMELWEQKGSKNGEIKKNKEKKKKNKKKNDKDGKEEPKPNINGKASTNTKEQPQNAKTPSKSPAKSKQLPSPTKSATKFTVSPKENVKDDNVVNSKATTPSAKQQKPKLISSTGKFQITPLLQNKAVEPKQSSTNSTKASVIKRIDLSNALASSKLFDNNQDDDDEEEDEDLDMSEEKPSIPQTKRKDAFFLKENGEEVSEDDEEDETEEKAPSQKDSVGGFSKGNFAGGQKKFGGGKPFDNRKPGQQQFNGNSRNSFGNNNKSSPFQKRENFRSPGGNRPGQSPRFGGAPSTQPKENGGANMHPSWQAKMAEKNKMQKVSIGGNTMNKKIKFA